MHDLNSTCQWSVEALMMYGIVHCCAKCLNASCDLTEYPKYMYIILTSAAFTKISRPKNNSVRQKLLEVKQSILANMNGKLYTVS